MSPLHRDVRRQTKRHRTTIGPAELYLDDVQDIAIALENFGGKNPPEDELAVESARADEDESGGDNGSNYAPRFHNVEVAADDAVADSVDDLRHATAEELGFLSLTTKDDRVRIDLWLRNADIAVKSTDAEARAIAEDIAEFIRKRRTWRGFFKVLPKGSWLAVLVPLTLNAFKAIEELRKTEPDMVSVYVTFGISTGLIPLALLGAAVYLVRATGSIHVVPEWRANARGISKRGQRDLLIVLLGAVIGGIIAGVLGFWNGLLAK